MKIIEEGTLLKEKEKQTYRIRCTHCGCVFEFTREEFHTLVKGIDVNPTGTVLCPQCGTELPVYKEHEKRD